MRSSRYAAAHLPARQQRSYSEQCLNDLCVNPKATATPGLGLGTLQVCASKQFEQTRTQWILSDTRLYAAVHTGEHELKYCSGREGLGRPHCCVSRSLTSICSLPSSVPALPHARCQCTLHRSHAQLGPFNAVPSLNASKLDAVSIILVGSTP